MKKRSIRWAIFLVVGIIATIISKHCKAEDAWDPLSGDPWQPPEWIVSEAPMPTATPEPTPEPTEDLPAALPTQGNLRGASTAVPTEVIEDDFYTPPRVSSENYIFDVYTRAGMFTFNFNNPSILYLSSFNSSLSGLNGTLNPWPLYWDTIRYKEDTSINLKNYFSIPYTNTSNSGVGIRSGGYYYNFYLNPQVPLSTDNNLDIHIQHKVQIGFNYPTNANDIAIFQAVAPDISTLDDMPVSIFTRLVTSDGDTIDDYYTIPFGVLSDFKISLDFDSLPIGSTVVSIRVGVAINWFPYNNPVVLQFDDYYQKNNISATYYPQYKFTPAGQAQIKVQITEDQQVKKSWLKAALDWLFIPDPAMLSNLFSTSLGDPNTGGSYLALGMRQTLYNHLLSTDTPHAILNLPTIDIPLDNHSYRIFDGYTFDLTDFYNGSSAVGSERPPLATLMQGVRFIMTALMFSAFFQSLWSITCAVFGLHWWSGTSSEDISEADV